MTVIKTPELPKIRHVHVLIGMGTGTDLGVHNNNLANAERAILERVFLVSGPNGYTMPPQPTVSIGDRLRDFRKLLLFHMPILTPLTHQQFVDGYEGQKRNMYQRAADSLIINSIEYKDSFITAFVKAEKINFSAKVNPAPRLIQPRSPRFNVAVGIYLKPVEHSLYEAVASVFGSPTVMKGFNAVDTGAVMRQKWERFNDPIAVGLDASRFDQHVSVPMLKWEHTIYNRCFNNDTELKKLLRWQIYNRGYVNCVDGRIKYQTNGCRMSGDMNTGLGNCLIMCALVWSFFKDKCDIELANNGDDCVVFMERTNIHYMSGLPLWFTEMGFTMKVEKPVTIFEEVEFCQTRPVFDGVKWRMTRDPRICTDKDLICIKSVQTEHEWKNRCQAIADGGRAAYGDLPVYWAFYQALNVGGKAVKTERLQCGFDFLAHGLKHRFAKPTQESRLSFFLAFGITPDEQEAIEEFYFGLNLVYQPGPLDKNKLSTTELTTLKA
jgi:hypothetical protein